jgi:hypothetical protein
MQMPDIILQADSVIVKSITTNNRNELTLMPRRDISESNSYGEIKTITNGLMKGLYLYCWYDDYIQ